jgi:hypothetical protein
MKICPINKNGVLFLKKYGNPGADQAGLRESEREREKERKKERVGERERDK